MVHKVKIQLTLKSVIGTELSFCRGYKNILKTLPFSLWDYEETLQNIVEGVRRALQDPIFHSADCLQTVVSQWSLLL